MVAMVGMQKRRILPETMFAPELGEILTRVVRPFVVMYKGESITVDLPGYYSASSDEGVLIGDDMAPADQALRILKERTDGLPATIKRIRAKLRLSQREAGALFKVGENAFDKYERGLITPSGPTVQLIKMLDRHPELVDELR
jgi:HTH-type transcriptional regulator / antitoxin MqsA